MGAALRMFPFTSNEVREDFVSAEQLMRVCDQVWSADRKADIPLQRQQPRPASSIYCKVDHLVGLFDTLRKVRNRVVLVSSESDRPITAEFLGRCPPQIAHWFSTNIEVEDEPVKGTATWPGKLLLRYYSQSIPDRGEIPGHSRAARIGST